MNSGLEVVERRNHSLVVSYYNDPTNNKPGTDATIYDPAPDFKFQNNTANYILLTTEVDMDSKELHFTFWGTSDGREGWYDAPTLLGWTGAGEPVRKETTDLAPGQEKCQAAHPGASTTFDYHVKYADGTQVDKTFASVYRALPKICLVGVETLSEPATETPAAEASTETPTETEAEATTTP
jgi:vancomycin resistance protein YoaR